MSIRYFFKYKFEKKGLKIATLLTFKELHAIVSKLFPGVGSCFTLYYEDEDKDQIFLSNEDDVAVMNDDLQDENGKDSKFNLLVVEQGALPVDVHTLDVGLYFVDSNSGEFVRYANSASLSINRKKHRMNSKEFKREVFKKDLKKKKMAKRLKEISERYENKIMQIKMETEYKIDSIKLKQQAIKQKCQQFELQEDK